MHHNLTISVLVDAWSELANKIGLDYTQHPPPMITRYIGMVVQLYVCTIQAHLIWDITIILSLTQTGFLSPGTAVRHFSEL